MAQLLLRASSLALRSSAASILNSALPVVSLLSHLQLRHFSVPSATTQLRQIDSLAAYSPLLSPALARLNLSASNGVGLYTVKVVTGRRRGAGTNAQVTVQLYFALGCTEKFLLDTEDRGFERGSSNVFHIPVQKDLGPLRRVHVEKRDTSAHEISRGWYLQHVEVQSDNGEKTLFPCNAWLGDSGAFEESSPTLLAPATIAVRPTAPFERNLLPAATEMRMGLQEPVQVTAAGLSIPHPDKVMKQKLKGVNHRGSGFAGEDAYFYCDGRNGLFGMGVADGVYMWREAGINSGIMSQTLMAQSRRMIEEGADDVFKVLQSSSRHVVSQGLQGSCTACLLTINQASGQLHSANLGDSGFLVLGKPQSQRGQATTSGLEVKFRTTQLEHDFGRPFQIGHHEHANQAEDADLVSINVCRGDIVVMGTDGLLDNVADAEICSTLTQQLAQGAGPGKMAQVLVKQAFEASLDNKRVTPYAQDASEAFNMVYNGGKKDDITVLVAQCK